MLRPALPLFALLLLAACASTPPGGTSLGTTARSQKSKPRITVSRAYAPPPGFPNFVDHSIGREEISIEAMALVGVPYRWGGNTPDSGFDCSGLVRYVVSRAAAVNLPRVTADMSERGTSIDPDEIAPGDLIFFNTTGRAHSHVGIYVGKLRFVNAPSTGGTVRIDYLTNPYWASRFDGIRRVAAPQDVPAPLDAPVGTPVYAGTGAGTTVTRATEAPAAPAVPAVTTSYAAAPVRATPAPARAAATDAYEPPPGYTPQAATAAAPARDPIDTAADAFEPPPPSASAAERQAQAIESGSYSPVARASAGDDPIASFAGASN